jgi:hypothetical protein
MTKRLQKCLEAGSIQALFPLLSDWPQDELRALLDDIEECYKAERLRTKALTQKYLFMPENFLNDSNAKAILEAEKAANINALAIFSEIRSVVMHYLPESEWPATEEK